MTPSLANLVKQDTLQIWGFPTWVRNFFNRNLYGARNQQRINVTMEMLGVEYGWNLIGQFKGFISLNSVL